MTGPPADTAVPGGTTTMAGMSDGGARTQTLADVVASEWIKVRTVRSTWWTLATAVVLTVGFGVLLSAGTALTWDDAEGSFGQVDAVALSLAGMLFGELALAVFGVLFITSEYSTGAIRTTLVAVPRRSRVVVAKAVVVAGVTLVVAAVAVFVSFFAGQSLLATEGLAVGIGEPNVVRALVGSVLYLVAAALFGLGVGLVVRNTGGGITAAVVGLIVAPSLSGLLPGQWGAAVNRFVTSNPGRPVTSVETIPDQLGPWVGYAVFVAWGLALLVAGTVLLRTRDA